MLEIFIDAMSTFKDAMSASMACMTPSTWCRTPLSPFPSFWPPRGGESRSEGGPVAETGLAARTRESGEAVAFVSVVFAPVALFRATISLLALVCTGAGCFLVLLLMARRAARISPDLGRGSLRKCLCRIIRERTRGNKRIPSSGVFQIHLGEPRQALQTL